MKPEKNLSEVVKPVSAIMSFDTDDLSVEELDQIIAGLRKIRERKHHVQELNKLFHELLTEAHNLQLDVYGMENYDGKLMEIMVQ
jgi:hemerythrin-like domain-containing protein